MTGVISGKGQRGERGYLEFWLIGSQQETSRGPAIAYRYRLPYFVSKFQFLHIQCVITQVYHDLIIADILLHSSSGRSQQSGWFLGDSWLSLTFLKLSWSLYNSWKANVNWSGYVLSAQCSWLHDCQFPVTYPNWQTSSPVSCQSQLMGQVGNLIGVITPRKIADSPDA